MVLALEVPLRECMVGTRGAQEMQSSPSRPPVAEWEDDGPRYRPTALGVPSVLAHAL